MSFEYAQELADAVLLEGYVLYPYRADSRKNRYRWTFGVLAPPALAAVDPSERSWLEVQVLLSNPGRGVEGRLRFLEVERRTIQEIFGHTYRDVDRLDVDGQPHLSWEEGVLRSFDFTIDTRAESAVTEVEIATTPSSIVDGIVDGRNRTVGRSVRARYGLRGRILGRAERLPGGATRVTVRVENLTPYSGPLRRSEAMTAALASTHCLLAAPGGAFASIVDPPPGLGPHAAACRSLGTYPVFLGPERPDLAIASPIILEDGARIAPESPGDFHDSGEIDELLTLRTKTLTEEEKTLARATDPRAAAVLGRVDAMTDDALERLHGALRSKAPAAAYERGQRVRLRPGARRTDAQDLLFAGLAATVEEVKTDVEGRTVLAVTIDDDPAREHHRWYGRYHYYYLDEVEPAGAP